MKKIIILINILIFQFSIAQDRYIDIQFFKEYQDLEIINYALKNLNLDYKICSYLSSENSLDKKMAVVNAYITDDDSEAPELFKSFLFHKYDIDSISKINNIEDRLILGYLFSSSNPTKSNEIIENTSKTYSNKLSYNILKLLINLNNSKTISECTLWKTFQEIDNNVSLIKDFKTTAIDYIAFKINDSKQYCNSTDLALTKTKRLNLIKVAKEVNTNRFKLNSKGGVYTINLKINNILDLDFIYDSGASLTLIPYDVFRVLSRAGTIDKTDLVGTQKFTIASGETIEKTVFIIKSLKLGNITVNNIKAAVGNTESDLLLGQSFYKRFSSVQIDYITNELLIER